MADVANDDRLVPVVWVGLDEAPILLANQFVMQGDNDEFVLTIGQLAPPVLLGSLDDRRQQAEAIAYVGVKPLARVSLTSERLRELIEVLTTHRDKAFAGRPRGTE